MGGGHDIAVFVYDADEKSVWLSEQPLDFPRPNGLPMIADHIQVELPLTAKRKTAKGIDALGRRIAGKWLEKNLKKLRSDTKGIVLLVDEEGAKAIEGRRRAALMRLIDTLPYRVLFDVRNHAAGWSRFDGGHLEFNESSPLRGHLTDRGQLTILRFNSHSREARIDAGAWSIVALDLKLAWTGAAPSSMREELASLHTMIGRSEMNVWKELARLFWEEVSPALEDPFVKQQPLYLNRIMLVDDTGYSQKPAELQFRRGSADELVALLRATVILALNGPFAFHYEEHLENWEHFTFKMMAAGDGRDARLLDAIYLTLQSGPRNMVETILKLMNPKGQEWARWGNQRISGAKRRPATFYARFDRDDLAEVSAHELLAASTLISGFLTENGITETMAQLMIENL